jgi:cytochrome oxidase Cu insertion factor (SCO1/SenC/PrrC family)
MSRAVMALLAVSIIALIGAVGWFGWNNYGNRNPAGEAKRPTIGGPFSLTDQDGRTFTDADLKGKPTLLYFGYTFCPDVCPTTLLLMENAAESLGADGPQKVNLVFITIDPERDTAKLMKEYVTSFGPTMKGLTGTPAQIASVARAYDVYYEKAPSKEGSPYLMAHSSTIYLLDRQGRSVGFFPPDSTAEAITKGLMELP